MLDKFKEKFFLSEASINVLLFQAMTISASLILFVAAVYALIVNLKYYVVLGLFIDSIVMLCLLIIARKTRKFTLCTILMLLTFNLMVLPYFYIIVGGFHSGMPLWFAFGIIVLFFLLRGKVLYITVTVSALVDVFWFTYSWKYPDKIVSLGSETGVYQNVLFSFFFVVAILCCFMKIQVQLFENERKRFKIQQKQLEEAMQTQSRFLANMSHEIRTPINTIIGLNEMTLREEISDEVAENSLHIQSASKMLLAVINDILDLSKIESGAMEIVESRYELGNMFSDIVNMNWVRAQEKGLEFQVSISEQLPSMLYGDDTRIKQVINNLLSNAIKYTPEGSVSLAVGGEVLDVNRVELQVSVADTGIGIKQNDVPHLFENFKRVDEINTKGIEGTGLGLSICSQLVELMNGTISVDSVYHKGSTFTVTFEQGIIDASPVGTFDYSAKLSRKRQQYTKNFEAPEARVLVVDDNDMNLLVAKKLLRESAVKLDLAISGAECLQLTEQNTYDLIFMDHMMPKMDGVETLEKVRSQSGGFNKKTPVVALTANAMSGAEEHYRRYGFSDYLAKPISGILLEAMLLRYLPENKVEYMADESDSQDWKGLSLKKSMHRDKVAVTTDSICDLPAELLNQFNIEYLFYYVNTDAGHFEEEKEIHTDSVLAHLESGGVACSEPPSVSEYENFFGEMLQKAEQVIHIAMASGSGEGYARACEAAKGFSHVMVFDSGHLSSGMGFLVLQAAREAMLGTEPKEIVKKLKEQKREVSTSFILSSPDQLYRSGRLGKIVWQISKYLSAHPVLAMRKGKISIAKIYFEETDKAYMDYIYRELKGKKNLDTNVLFFTFAGMSDEQRKRILAEIRKYQSFDKIYEIPASAAISSNCGGGTFGLIYKRRGVQAEL